MKQTKNSNSLPTRWPFPAELMEGQLEGQRAALAKAGFLTGPSCEVLPAQKAQRRSRRPPLNDIPDAPY